MMTFERKNLTTDNAIKELGSEENVELWLELRTPDLTTVANGDQIWANFTPYLRHKYIGMDGKINGNIIPPPKVVIIIIINTVVTNKSLSASTCNT